MGKRTLEDRHPFGRWLLSRRRRGAGVVGEFREALRFVLMVVVSAESRFPGEKRGGEKLEYVLGVALKLVNFAALGFVGGMVARVILTAIAEVLVEAVNAGAARRSGDRIPDLSDELDELVALFDDLGEDESPVELLRLRAGGERLPAAE